MSRSNMLKQAKYCTPEELADYLIAAGLSLPTRCKDCKKYEPIHIRPFLGVCQVWDTVVKENGFCHHGERRPDERKID